MQKTDGKHCLQCGKEFFAKPRYAKAFEQQKDMDSGAINQKGRGRWISM